ncbi:MAG TPA: hypothetical protein VKB43_03845 [Gaiellaceae bacterium]|nr:hypothetical protein [Gaiellaceae bacterium]
MAVARVVNFEGVDSARMAELKNEVEGSDKPEGLPATEMMILHDPESDSAIAIVFFDNDEDYQTGDAFLSAMPTSDTPGTRTSVKKHDVAVRMTG